MPSLQGTEPPLLPGSVGEAERLWLWPAGSTEPCPPTPLPPLFPIAVVRAFITHLWVSCQTPAGASPLEPRAHNHSHIIPTLVASGFHLQSGFITLRTLTHTGCEWLSSRMAMEGQ